MKITKLVCLAGLAVAAATVGAAIAISNKNLSTVQKVEPSLTSQQEDIVKAQKLKDDLESACKARNMQACEQIGITKEDVARTDSIDQISAKLKDDLAKIKQERDRKAP